MMMRMSEALASATRRSAGMLRWLVVFLVVVAHALPIDAQLIEAVKAGDTKTAAAVLKRKVDVNVAQPDGTTALHWAVYQDDLPVVRLLVRAGANVNAANINGMTPLMLASTNGGHDVVRDLLAAG